MCEGVERGEMRRKEGGGGGGGGLLAKAVLGIRELSGLVWVLQLHD